MISIIILVFQLFAGDLDEKLKQEFTTDDLKNAEKTTLKFKNQKGILSDKYDCICLKDFINTNHNYTIEFISKSGKVAIKTDYTKFDNTFYPIFIIDKNISNNEYKMPLQDKGVNEFELEKLDKEIEKTVDKIVQINSHSNEFQMNSIIFIDKNNQFQEYKNIKKIVFYRHL